LKAKTIIAKYSRARDNAASSQEYFDDLDRAAPPNERDEWKEAIEAAEKGRSTDIEKMDYMLPRYTNGATLKEIEADMANKIPDLLILQPIMGPLPRGLLKASNSRTASLFPLF